MTMTFNLVSNQTTVDAEGKPETQYYTIAVDDATQFLANLWDTIKDRDIEIVMQTDNVEQARGTIKFFDFNSNRVMSAINIGVNWEA